ncbi:hypothetical protein CBR_g21182 [Chara braunii]|uniref:Uncharacterized protein n=1 Tax=Chara braunii TaxID=69332 RepID=A0A388L0W0_CHABU|nr:hypothetical protein CBR_g21182 [Chara braunii]|eukprot:GBG75940.1 hypothetical protein CBR_g21182 [Chara braunii]
MRFRAAFSCLSRGQERQAKYEDAEDVRRTGHSEKQALASSIALDEPEKPTSRPAAELNVPPPRIGVDESKQLPSKPSPEALQATENNPVTPPQATANNPVTLPKIAVEDSRQPQATENNPVTLPKIAVEDSRQPPTRPTPDLDDQKRVDRKRYAMEDRPVIGIDLGTSYCCVAVFRNIDDVEVVPNDLGERITPSYVAFTDEDEPLVGTAAKKEGIKHPKQCIYEVKRLIGRSFRDPAVQQDAKRWPFKVSSGPLNEAVLEVPESPGRQSSFKPEEISTLLLKKMKEIAEEYTNCRPITDAVITVPAYFHHSQRKSTMAAGKSAGLNVLRLMSEPTAAALAYGHKRLIGRGPVGKKLLVFDLGGGTFDVSIVTVKEGPDGDCSFVVNAVAGDSHLGGTDIDERLLQHVAERFKRQLDGEDLLGNPGVLPRLKQVVVDAKHTLSVKKETETSVAGDSHLGGTDIDERLLQHVAERFKKDQLDGEDLLGNPRVLARLKQVVVDTKHTLSVKKETEIDLEYGDRVLSVKLGRAEFEALNEDLFGRCIKIVEQALLDAKLSKDEISDVVLAGGSTRIPKVQEMLTTFFGRPPIKSINADEAVAFGAAVQAGLLARSDKCAEASISVRDVTAVSIGVNLSLDFMKVLIPRNSPLPATGRTELLYFHKFARRRVHKVGLFEGERALCAYNRLLGELRMDSFKQVVSTSLVVINIDAHGILHATLEARAGHKEIGKKVETVVTLDADTVQSSGGGTEALDWYTPAAKAEDARIWAASDSLSRLALLIIKLQKRQSSNKLPVELAKHLGEALTWFNGQQELASKEEYDQRYAELDRLARTYGCLVDTPAARSLAGALVKV